METVEINSSTQVPILTLDGTDILNLVGFSE
ncbi:MAG: hypothetical protein ACI93P_000374 [bacterium]|jgi:hypothetical protein